VLLPRLVILFEISPTRRDETRYTRTLKDDLEISFWDLSVLLNKKRSVVYADHSVLAKGIKCNRFLQFVRLFRKQGRNTIYISRLGNSSRANLIHLFIKAFGGVITKSPQSCVPSKSITGGSSIKLYAKSIRDTLIRLVESFIMDYAVITSLDAEKNSSVKNKIYSHQFDYETYSKLNNVPEIESRKYFVFLDEFVPFHPDNMGRQVSDCQPNKYYSSINKTFNELEKEFNTNIIIAAHPRAKYKDNPFDGRKIVHGNTGEWVKNSDVVLIHASTAVSFAVLNYRPVISLISSLYSEYYRSTILDMNLSIGSYLYNIDLKIGLFETPEVNKVVFKNYLDNYIRHPKAVKPYWIDEVLDYLGHS
jgi:hypothetical protein